MKGLFFIAAITLGALVLWLRQCDQSPLQSRSGPDSSASAPREPRPLATEAPSAVEPTPPAKPTRRPVEAALPPKKKIQPALASTKVVRGPDSGREPNMVKAEQTPISEAPISEVPAAAPSPSPRDEVLQLPPLIQQPKIEIASSPSSLIKIEAGQQVALITWVPLSSSSKSSSERQWLRFCEKLGQGLQTRGIRPGFLHSYQCQPFGTPYPKVPTGQWLIQIIEEENGLRLAMSYHRDDSEVRTSDLRLSSDSDSGPSLQNPQLAKVLARLVIDQSPTGWAVSLAQPGNTFTLESDTQALGFPSELVLYDLYLDPQSKRWVPLIKGRMKRQARSENPNGLRLETYDLIARYTPLRSQQSYWAQNLKGPGQRPRDTERFVRQSLPGFSFENFFDSILFNPLQSSFLGLRYGRSVLRGHSINSQTSLFSLLLELRSGIFSGLRFYYDRMPEVQRGRGVTKEIFSLHRAALGWAFGFDLPHQLHGIAKQIDIQPKLGLLDVKLRINYPISEFATVPLSFRGKDVMDFSVEIGLENDISVLHGRLWSSLSSASFGLFSRSKVAVESYKIGLDLSHNLFKDKKSWGLNILGFAHYDRMKISQDSNSIKYSEENLGINSINFNLFMIGGGLTLAW